MKRQEQSTHNCDNDQQADGERNAHLRLLYLLLFRLRTLGVSLDIPIALFSGRVCFFAARGRGRSSGVAVSDSGTAGLRLLLLLGLLSLALVVD